MRRRLIVVSLTLGLGALVLVLDQASKAWAMHALRPLPPGGGIQIFESWFKLAWAENRSAAFGILTMLPYDLRRWVLTGFALVAVAALLGALFTGRIQRRWTAAAAGLILGGALGNVVDRLQLGYVVDFIVWHVGDRFYWPTFNVADSGIVVGVFMLLGGSYVQDRQEMAPSAEAAKQRA